VIKEEGTGGTMKKPLTISEEQQPRNIARADIVIKEGFGLEVDGRMKMQFSDHAAAQKRALELKAEFPMLQVKIFDAVENTRTLIEPETHTSPIKE
jgi:hypothetical protein